MSNRATQGLTTGQVAAICFVSQNTVKKWCDRGILKCQTLPGRHRRIHWGDLLAFAERYNWDGVVAALQRFKTS